MPYGTITGPIKSDWTILYIQKEDREAREIKALVSRWCEARRRTCNIVLLINREPPSAVTILPCLRTAEGYLQGSHNIKRFIREDLRAA